MNSRPVKRIEDVVRLRTAQFSEDSGPISHPIRPESYIKMDNFYTVTVYEKGAEIIRVYHTLLGKQGFRSGVRRGFSTVSFDMLPLSIIPELTIHIRVPCTVESRSQAFSFPSSSLFTCTKCISWSMLWCWGNKKHGFCHTTTFVVL